MEVLLILLICVASIVRVNTPNVESPLIRLQTLGVPIT